MSTKNITEHLVELTAMAKMYVSDYAKWLKLDALEKSSRVGAYILRSVVMIVLVGLVLLFISVAFSLWYGRAYDDYVAGFLISAGFHAALVLIVILFRKHLINAPVIKTFAKIIFYQKDED